jgi:nickel superoxide dismutase
VKDLKEESEMLHSLVAALDSKLAFERAEAHCDVPCGIYDPHAAQIDALTVVRMLDLQADLDKSNPEHSAAFRNSMVRYTLVKEEHAEKCKREIRVIWGDYFKAQHIEKYPQLHGLVHKIMTLGSKVRQTADRQNGLDLVEAVNEFAQIFWETKGVATKRVKAPYAPGLEIVYPIL